MVPTNLAPDWIAAWNSHDLDRVLAFYSDDFKMSSPYIANIAGEPSGTLHGKAAIRAYWEKAMSLFPDLHFTLNTAYLGVNSVVICYTNQAGGRRGEILFFGKDGKCFQTDAHHA
jgi:ketosteroid isomerase-like protein